MMGGGGGTSFGSNAVVELLQKDMRMMREELMMHAERISSQNVERLVKEKT